MIVELVAAEGDVVDSVVDVEHRYLRGHRSTWFENNSVALLSCKDELHSAPESRRRRHAVPSACGVQGVAVLGSRARCRNLALLSVGVRYSMASFRLAAHRASSP